MYPHISSLLSLPPSHPPYPIPLGGHKALSWSPCAIDNENSFKNIATEDINIVIQRSYRNLENSWMTTEHKYNN